MLDFDPEKRPTMKEVFFGVNNVIQNVWANESDI